MLSFAFYTQAEGKISLTLEGLEQKIHHHAHLRFEVADNGFGMSEAFIQTIFDPFARENTAHNREIKGSGLGMAITKNIVDLMGGTITVQSTVGQGSLFTVEIELQIVDEHPAKTFWQFHQLHRLLVVNEDESICLDVKSLMENAGVQVSYALDDFMASDMAARAFQMGEPFDLFLMDWDTSAKERGEVIRHLREIGNGKVPIVAMTFRDFSTSDGAFSYGLNAFLQKPFFISRFQHVVSQIYGDPSYVPESHLKEEISLQGMHVLVAEDNNMNAVITLELMNLEGATCELVSNGKQAVERFLASKGGEFDIILMDVQMPVMDGYEATKHIRASNHPDAKSIPIVALTANAFEDDVQKALDAGMNAHTVKPVDPDFLKALVFHFGNHQKN